MVAQLPVLGTVMPACTHELTITRPTCCCRHFPDLVLHRIVIFLLPQGERHPVMKNTSIGLILIAGICGIVYLPSVFAADKLDKENPKSAAETRLSQIEISCQITMTDAAGKSEIVAAPKVVSVEGKTATVAITQDNGESIEIQLIGRLHNNAKPAGTKKERSNRK